MDDDAKKVYQICRDIMQYRAKPRKIIEATSMARPYLAMLISEGLRGSVLYLDSFLEDISANTHSRALKCYGDRLSSMTSPENDLCTSCKMPVEEACFRKDGEPITLWHNHCLECSNCRLRGLVADNSLARDATRKLKCISCWASLDKDIYHVTLLEQYTHLLWVALARLGPPKDFDFSAPVEEHMEAIQRRLATAEQTLPSRRSFSESLKMLHLHFGKSKLYALE